MLPDYDSDEITAEKMAKNLTYSKAVLKETFRLNPVSVGVGRNLNTDLILSGYEVPKGVSVSNLNIRSLSCCKEKNGTNAFYSSSHSFRNCTQLKVLVLFILPDDNSDAKLHFMSIGQVF